MLAIEMWIKTVDKLALKIKSKIVPMLSTQDGGNLGLHKAIYRVIHRKVVTNSINPFYKKKIITIIWFCILPQGRSCVLGGRVGYQISRDGRKSLQNVN